MPIDFHKALNAEQLRVVEQGDGPTLVLAGAGSGKTRTIVYRVAWLLEQGIDPASILLVTFTNKAATEMISRLGELVGHSLSSLAAGTFHAIANRWLRVEAHRLGFDASFSILDRDDSIALIKAAVKDERIPVTQKRFPSAAVIQSIISYAANARVSLEEAIDRTHASAATWTTELQSIRRRYTEKKRVSNAMDFDDLLEQVLTLFIEHPEVEQRLAEQFRYILVDEYQDTNALQSEIVMRLSRVHRNVLVVGDDAQSIYSFRAADIRNILEFPRRFGTSQTFRLESNYRSTPDIVALANASIAHNRDQFEKTLQAMRAAEERPILVQVRTIREEAQYIAESIEAAVRGGTAPSSIAVLFRAAYQSQALEFELMRRQVAYEYRGGMRFFERAHIKDVLCVLRLLDNTHDQAAWLRILGWMPGVGLTTAQKMISVVAGRSIVELTDALFAPTLPARARAGWQETQALLRQVAKASTVADEVRAVMRTTYADYLEAEYTNPADRLEDIAQLARFAESYVDQRQRFLEEVTLQDALASSLDVAGADRVVLSTIHQAKGLEWDHVYVLSLMDGYFPNRRALFDAEGMEEERRLFYVAATRARRRLCLTMSMMGGAEGVEACVPSLFVQELPVSTYERVTLGAARRAEHRFLPQVIEDGYDEPVIVLDSEGERGTFRYLSS